MNRRKANALRSALRGQQERAQQLAWRQHVRVVAGHEIDDRDLSRLAAPRPEGADALERRRQRDHRPRRQRHADVPAHRRLVPDLERREERPAALAEQRGRLPVGRRLGAELIELHHLAGGGDLQTLLRGDQRGPVERLQVDERVHVDLGLREQPGPAGQPGKSGFPGGDLLRAGGSTNAIDGVQVHGWQPPVWGRTVTRFRSLDDSATDFSMRGRTDRAVNDDRPRLSGLVWPWGMATPSASRVRSLVPGKTDLTRTQGIYLDKPG